MHMADALLSPAVGGIMWGASAGTVAYCSAKIKKEMDSSKVPLMGVLGAFIFAAQMINFTIPATGSSGHLGGGIILAVLLGPHAAFLTIASVLVVQALFFADGGLLALGSNIFNLGIFPAFIAYPFIYRPIAGDSPTRQRIAAASVVSAIVGLQLGAFAVVLETVFSGISSLPFSTFVAVMQPIHLGIGFVEGVVTAAVISFVHKARPEIVSGAGLASTTPVMKLRNLILAFFAVAMITGGILSWFASENPDGLEWAIAKATGRESLENNKAGLHGVLSAVQEQLAFLPDYSIKKHESAAGEVAGPAAPQALAVGNQETRTGVGGRLGTTVSGVIGGLITLGITFLVGYILKRRSRSG
jgi:cobalt/nickel transport system permease protein